MKHDLILTAKGHPGTQKRMEQEFNLIKLWEQPDRAAALKAAGVNPEPKYTEFPGVGHGSWGPAYEKAELWEWMFAQSR